MIALWKGRFLRSGPYRNSRIMSQWICFRRGLQATWEAGYKISHFLHFTDARFRATKSRYTLWV